MDISAFQSALTGQAPANAPVATAPASTPAPKGDFASSFAAALAGGTETPATPATLAQPKITPTPAPETAPVATQDWNGQKIPASIPTKKFSSL